MGAGWKKARMATLIPIKKMDRALRFYTKVLGARLGERGRGRMRNSWASVRLLGEELWLIEPSERERRKLAYQTFLVKDVRRVVAQLRERGVRFQRAEKMGPQTKVEGPIAIEPFGSSAFFQDPEGNTFMVWENNPPM
jgi:catechol 2,3-dioxygenase-like lactoylglutathione lyase family enzyme